jgi:maltose alpha-D-glucosyltransferase/alpha-amylase
MNWNKLHKNDDDLVQLVQTSVRSFMQKARWYGGKANPDKAFVIDHLLRIKFRGKTYYLLLVEILYDQGFVHNYLLPLARVQRAEVEDASAVICPYPGTEDHLLVDAVYVDGFRKALFSLMEDGKNLALEGSELAFERGKVLRRYKRGRKLSTSVLNAEQSNTTIVYDGQFYLKLYRRLFRDENPDIEMVHFLSERTKFAHVPSFAASITWKRKGIYDVSFGMMQAKVENHGDAWTWMLGHLDTAFQRLRKKRLTADDLPQTPVFTGQPLNSLPDIITEILSWELMEGIKTLAVRTAEMHINVSNDPVNRNFSKETYNGDYTVWMKNRLNYQFEARYALLDKRIGRLSQIAKYYARYFLDNKTEIKNRIFAFDEEHLSGQRIRIHGDYHLGQILVLDDDFCILDFEGEPESTIHDRKVKQSALKDVSGMFRSFHYAIYSTIFSKRLSKEKRRAWYEMGERLYNWMINVFLYYYLEQIYNSHLNLGYRQEVGYLLRYHLLEKAIYELGYELNARPSWAIIPLRGIYTILASEN